MLIQQLRKHFPARFPEWANSFIMASWGFYMILHPSMFEVEPTATMLAGLVRIQMSWGIGAEYPPFSVWGLITLFVGMIRSGALFVNGAYSRTPVIRMSGAAVSAFIWAQVVAGLLVTGIPNLGIVVYSWLVIIDIACAYRAGNDIGVSEKQRKAVRADEHDDNDSGGLRRSFLGLHRFSH